MTSEEGHEFTGTVRNGQRWSEILVDHRVHGDARVPGDVRRRFDLHAFSRAREQHDVEYQASCYELTANLRIVDPEHPPSAPLIVVGRASIRTWLLNFSARSLDRHVTHLVDGGDRVAFAERWHDPDGLEILAASTAELDGALITTQHTIFV